MIQVMALMRIFHKYIIFFVGIILGIFIAINIIGIAIGNMLYLMLNKQRLDNLVPALADYSQNVAQIKEYENEKKWKRITINADDGSKMTGTYIKNSSSVNKAVIILHGLYQNRSMSINYVSLYQKLGFNILLVDLRGHGESQGQMTWGKSETADIDEWIAYLKNQESNSIIGIHGISLGAAYAVLHSGAYATTKADFYVEDSAYADLASIYQEKLQSFLQLNDNDAFVVKILSFYCQVSMYWHTGETMADLSPLKAIHNDKKPMLFLHGGADMLVPAASMQKLYDACPAYKELYVFPAAQHAVSIASNPGEYYDALKKFLNDIKVIDL